MAWYENKSERMVMKMVYFHHQVAPKRILHSPYRIRWSSVFTIVPFSSAIFFNMYEERKRSQTFQQETKFILTTRKLVAGNMTMGNGYSDGLKPLWTWVIYKITSQSYHLWDLPIIPPLIFISPTYSEVLMFCWKQILAVKEGVTLTKETELFITKCFHN